MDNFPDLGGKIGRTKVYQRFRGLSSKAHLSANYADTQLASDLAGTERNKQEEAGSIGSITDALTAAATTSKSAETDANGESADSKLSASSSVPSVTPLTDIDNLFLTSKDIVGINTIQGELTGAWLAVHAILGYRLIDVKLYGRNILEELKMHAPKD